MGSASTWNPSQAADDGPAKADAGLRVFGEDGHVLPLDEILRAAIQRASDEYRGGTSQLARDLKIGRSTLYRFYGEQR